MEQAKQYYSNLSSSLSRSIGSGNNYTTSDYSSTFSKYTGKIGFTLGLLIVFIILLQLGTTVLIWYFGPSKSPKLINGMVSGKELIIIPQSPSLPNAVTVYRSSNVATGIEFTWSVWILIDDLVYNHTKYRHIFHKGNDTIDNSTGLNFPNNAPGLYISPETNELTVIMNTYKTISEEVTIPDIPINKWINIILRCQNTTLDVYINGNIIRNVELSGIPKQNYGNVYVGMNGGFSGCLSNLWYYEYAITTSEVQNIVKKGPNLKQSSPSALSIISPDYLSLRWYFDGSGDGYN